MADPCVDDTPTIELNTAGSPAVLTANVRNHATTFSGTLGDDTTHNVNDNNTDHTLAQTFNVENGPAGSALTASVASQGIVVVALNPVFIAASGGDITITGFARLTIDSVIADERDMPGTGVDFPAGTSGFIPWGALVGQLDIPIGGDVDIDVELLIRQTGASGAWTFRWGGSKLVAELTY